MFFLPNFCGTCPNIQKTLLKLNNEAAAKHRQTMKFETIANRDTNGAGRRDRTARPHYPPEISDCDYPVAHSTNKQFTPLTDSMTERKRDYTTTRTVTSRTVNL